MLDHVQSQTLKKHQLKPQKSSLLEEENVGLELLVAKMIEGVHCQTTILCTRNFSKQKTNCPNTHITFPLCVRVSVQKIFPNEFSWKGL
jgi:hypothetical protein